MSTSAAPATPLRLSQQFVHALHAVLDREVGAESARVLQEIGASAGEGLWNDFVPWLEREYGVAEPGELDAGYLGEVVSRFLAEAGWGSMSVTELGTAVLALDSADWAEADPARGGPYPSCQLSCGLLADFLSRLAGGAIAVLEVECRSRGDARCRFLAANPAVLDRVYSAIAEERDYLAEALGAR